LESETIQLTTKHHSADRIEAFSDYFYFSPTNLCKDEDQNGIMNKENQREDSIEPARESQEPRKPKPPCKAKEESLLITRIEVCDRLRLQEYF